MKSERDRIVEGIRKFVTVNQDSDIPPALAPIEWIKKSANRQSIDTGLYDAKWQQETGEIMRVCEPGAFGECVPISDPNDLAALIALANAALHDEDPRKFTRERITALRFAAEIVSEHIETIGVIGAGNAGVDQRFAAESETHSQLLELADVIESYLPPEAQSEPQGER